jgi:hypothetical protein
MNNENRVEDFYPAIWNVLHDGVIVAVDGNVPGTLCLDVSIDYLRKRFSETGESIQILLTGCTRFAYREFEAATFSTELPIITAMEPEILSASMKDSVCEIECAAGVLEVVAAGGSARLDSGRAIPLQELIEVAECYWTEWSERAKQARLKPS